MKTTCVLQFVLAGFTTLLVSCGGGGSYGGGTPSNAYMPPPVVVTSSLAILPSQVVSGQIDLNGGASSHIDPLTVVATGGKTLSGYTWTTTTGFPLPHPSIAISGLQGVIAGRSTTLQQGLFTMYVTVTDDSGTPRNGLVTIDLRSTCNSNPATLIPCSSATLSTVHNDYLPAGKVGSDYAATILAGGGQPPYSWALASGTLPPGISIDQARGVIRGVPTTAGTYQFYVRVTDAVNATNNSEILAGVLAARFQLVVNP